MTVTSMTMDHENIGPLGMCTMQYRMNLEGYYKDTISTDSPSRSSMLQANLCAFEFWQRTFKVSVFL